MNNIFEYLILKNDAINIKFSKIKFGLILIFLKNLILSLTTILCLLIVGFIASSIIIFIIYLFNIFLQSFLPFIDSKAFVPLFMFFVITSGFCLSSALKTKKEIEEDYL